MKIRCGNCGTVYNIKDSLLAEKPRKVRCSKCNHTFIVKPPPPPPAAKTPSATPDQQIKPAQTPTPSVSKASPTPSKLSAERQKPSPRMQDTDEFMAIPKAKGAPPGKADPKMYVQTHKMSPYSPKVTPVKTPHKKADSHPSKEDSSSSIKEKEAVIKDSEAFEAPEAPTPQQKEPTETKPLESASKPAKEPEETSPFIHDFSTPSESPALDKVSSDSLFTDGKIFADVGETAAESPQIAADKGSVEPPFSDSKVFADTTSRPAYKPESETAPPQGAAEIEAPKPPFTERKPAPDTLIPPEQQAKTPAQEQKFKVKVEGEEYEDLDLMTVKKWIREGRLEPMDEVLSESGEWVIAADIPALMKYFRLKESIEASKPREGVTKDRSALEYCTTHPHEPARWKCSSCGRKFCSQCVKYETFGHIRVPVCDRCNDRCIEIKPPKMIKPFWAQIPQMLAYPFVRGGAWMTIIGFIVSFIPYIGLIIYPYSLYILKASAQGKKEMPDWPDFTDIWEDILAPTFRLILGSIIVFVPLGIYLYMKFAFMFDLNDISSFFKIIFDPINIVFIIFAWIYLPMVTIIVAVFNRLMPALNPVTVFRLIGAIKKEYFIALFLALAFGIVSGIIGGMMGVFPVIGKYLGKGINWYFLIVEMHMLGLMVYQVEEKLGWD
jgi:predicted Zn finger-like uncharacterized protein